jgi:hypothetical protein
LEILSSPHFATAPNDSKAIWQAVTSIEVIEGWNEFSGCQISGCSEDDHRTGIDRFIDHAGSGGHAKVWSVTLGKDIPLSVSVFTPPVHNPSSSWRKGIEIIHQKDLMLCFP